MKILFKIQKDQQHRIRFGEVTSLIQSCYFRGKELGYEDGNIYLEWPEKVAFNKEYRNKIYMDCPAYSILPINFIKKNNKSIVFDKIIYIDEPGAFYENSIPIYTGDSQDHISFMNYTNIYYYKFNQRPQFRIKDLNAPTYILFHIRIADWKEQRNVDIYTIDKLLGDLKKRYNGKCQFWKTGEKCRSLDRKFDFVAPYYKEDINKFWRMMSNASVFIGCESGPSAHAAAFGPPFILLDCLKDPEKGNWAPGYWESKRNLGTIGLNYYDYIDKDKMLIHFKGDPVDYDKIYKFTDRFINV